MQILEKRGFKQGPAFQMLRFPVGTLIRTDAGSRRAVYCCPSQGGTVFILILTFTREEFSMWHSGFPDKLVLLSGSKEELG